jgi:hypothetical protein
LRQGFAPTYWTGAIPFRQADSGLSGSALVIFVSRQ